MVVPVGLQPPPPPTPIELPTGRATLLDRPDETVVVLGGVDDLDLRRVAGETEARPLAARTRHGPEGVDLQGLDGDAPVLLAVPGDVHVLAAVKHGREHVPVGSQLFERTLANVGAETPDFGVDPLEGQVEGQLPHLLDQRLGLPRRTGLAGQSVMNRESHFLFLGSVCLPVAYTA